MKIYDFYNIVTEEKTSEISLESMSTEFSLLTNLFEISSSISFEGVGDFLHGLWKKFVSFVKKIAKWMKDFVGRVFQTGFLRKAVKASRYSSNIAYNGVYSVSDANNKFNDEEKKNFRKYIVSLKCFHWFAFGTGQKDITTLSESVRNLSDISRLMKEGSADLNIVTKELETVASLLSLKKKYIDNGTVERKERVEDEGLSGSGKTPLVQAVSSIKNIIINSYFTGPSFEEFYDNTLKVETREKQNAFFSNKVYDNHKELEKLVSSLSDFSNKASSYRENSGNDEGYKKAAIGLTSLFSKLSSLLSNVNADIILCAKTIASRKSKVGGLSKLVNAMETRKTIYVKNLFDGRLTNLTANLLKIPAAINFVRDSLSNIEVDTLNGNKVYILDDVKYKDNKNMYTYFKNYWGLSPGIAVFWQDIKGKHSYIMLTRALVEAKSKTNGASCGEAVMYHEMGHNIVWRSKSLFKRFAETFEETLALLKKLFREKIGDGPAYIFEKYLDNEKNPRIFKYVPEEMFCDCYAFKRTGDISPTIDLFKGNCSGPEGFSSNAIPFEKMLAGKERVKFLEDIKEYYDKK